MGEVFRGGGHTAPSLGIRTYAASHSHHRQLQRRPVARALLGRARAQTFRDFSVVVVDNASSDGSVESMGGSHPAVRLLRTKKTSVSPQGTTTGSHKSPLASGLHCSTRTRFPSRTGWNSLSSADANPMYAAFGSRNLATEDGAVLDGVGDEYHVSGNFWREGHGRQAAGLYLEPTEIFSPCAAAALYRTDALLSVGGFDEDYFCYGEDVDLGFRLRLAGYQCMYVPDAIVHHLGSAIVGVHSDFQVYHGHRNLVWNYVSRTCQDGCSGFTCPTMSR